MHEMDTEAQPEHSSATIAGPQASEPRRSLAPAWHTAVLLLLLGGTSITGVLTTHRVEDAGQHLALNYLLTMVWEWMLAAFVYWGLRLRRTPLRQILGPPATYRFGWLADAGIALAFWFCSMVVLGLVALALKPLHVDPDSIRKIVSHLAPATPLQLTLWIAMSITAGICEEFFFRGYLQQQFSVWTRRTWVGLALSAVVFGVAHGYEGIAGMLLITAYGALFGILAQWRGNLRPGMIAHAWHDSLSGIVLFAAQHIAHRTLA